MPNKLLYSLLVVIALPISLISNAKTIYVGAIYNNYKALNDSTILSKEETDIKLNNETVTNNPIGVKKNIPLSYEAFELFLIRDILSQLGYDIVVGYIPAGQILSSNNRAGYHVYAGVPPSSLAIQANLLFSETYVSDSYRFVVTNDFYKKNADTEDKLITFEDFQNFFEKKAIVVVRDTFIQDLIQFLFPNSPILALPVRTLLYGDTDSLQPEILLLNAAIADAYVNMTDGKYQTFGPILPNKEVAKASRHVQSYHSQAFGFPLSQKRLQLEVDKVIRNMKESGALIELTKKYLQKHSIP